MNSNLKDKWSMIKINLYRIISCAVFICLMTGCITSFEPVGVSDSAGILVVEGLILENGTTIKLKRTVPLDDTKGNYLSDTSHVSIYIIDDRNNVITQAKPQFLDGKLNPGVYITNEKFAFTPEAKYALDIKIRNKRYQSAFVSPLNTPEIDGLNWILNDDKSMDFMVSTHDPENKTTYFLWSVEEDWEIKSNLFGTVIYDQSTNTIIEQSLAGPNNRFYCWDSSTSKSLLLGSSDKLTSSVITDKKIHHIEPNTSRYSYLYSILLKQYGIDKEAYSYFENLQRNLEESGSLFAPQPTEKIGNIRCLSDPNERVIGYIAAAKETTHRLFIDMTGRNLIQEREQAYNCGELEAFPVEEVGAAYFKGLAIYYYSSQTHTFVCAPRLCIDCTAQGGTKRKPDFWPNDHQ